MDNTQIIIILLIIIAILLVIVIAKSHKNHVKTTTFSVNSKEDMQKILKDHNIPTDLFDTHFQTGTPSTITSTKNVRKVTYINGKKVSEEENSTQNKVVPLTNCPNCGAKIIDSTKNSCDYCDTVFTKQQNITIK